MTENYGLKLDQINAISQCFAKYPAITKVMLYGSRAKGNYKNGSDIDLTIMNSDLSPSDLSRLENDLDDLLLPYKIDLSIITKIQNVELLKHIERVGKLFFER